MTAAPRARTLDEAYLFVDLVVSRNEPADLRRLTELTRVDGRHVLRVAGWHEGVRHDFAVSVPATDTDDVRPGELYGSGPAPSTLIDAGQWRGVEEHAVTRIGALLEQAAPGGLTPAALDELSAHLDTAYSALAEIGRFLPEGADEVPAEAFWSPIGRLVRDRDPSAFRRDRLARDEAGYRSLAAQITAFEAAAGPAPR